MSIETHDRGDQGNFEQSLLLALTEADRNRPVINTESADPTRPNQTFRRVWRPAAFGIAAALIITGAVAASGVLGPRLFEPDGGVKVAGDQLAAKGSGCAPHAVVTISLDGKSIGTVVAVADGSFSASVPIPATATVGKHVAQASCVDAAGLPVVQTASITIVTTRPALGPEVNAVLVEGVPGGQVVVRVGPVKAGSDVAVTLDGRPFTMLHAGADGWLDAHFELPVDTSLGSHWLRATGSVPDGRAFDQSTEVTVISR